MALRKRGGGGKFLNLLQKKGVPRKEGVPSEKGGLQPQRKLLLQILDITKYFAKCFFFFYKYISR